MATDRIMEICELLLGAAHADGRFSRRERETVTELLDELTEGAVPEIVRARLVAFEPETFDLQAAAAPFRKDPVQDRLRLVYLVDAITEADDETDLAEDEFLRALVAALDLPPDAVAGLNMDVEVEEDLQETFAAVRRGPVEDEANAVDIDMD